MNTLSVHITLKLTIQKIVTWSLSITYENDCIFMLLVYTDQFIMMIIIYTSWFFSCIISGYIIEFENWLWREFWLALVSMIKLKMKTCIFNWHFRRYDKHFLSCDLSSWRNLMSKMCRYSIKEWIFRTFF